MPAGGKNRTRCAIEEVTDRNEGVSSMGSDLIDLEKKFCSTIYVMDKGQWRVALHQQTDA
jgi:hypothetical protein